jgi:adenylate cyclase
MPTHKRSFAAEEAERRKHHKKPWLWIAVVGILVIVVAILAGYALFSRNQISVKQDGEATVTGQKTPLRIAVLPFEDMSLDKDQESFCYGVAVEIINALTKVHGLTVIPRASSFSLKDKDIPITEIGYLLDVDWVLDGSLRKAGNTIRITTDLINTGDLSSLFTKTHEGEWGEIFAIMDKISLMVVDELNVKLLAGESEDIKQDLTHDPEALGLYMLGRHIFHQRLSPQYKQAIEYFEQAIERDPSFALAHVGIANIYNLMGLSGRGEYPDPFPRAREAVEKALELNPNSGEAHTSRAFITMNYERDFETAERQFKYAIELNPQYPLAYQWLHDCYRIQLRFAEALEQAKQAYELDPLAIRVQSAMMMSLINGKFYEEGLEYCRELLRKDPANAYSGYSKFYFLMGRYQEAMEARRTYISLRQIEAKDDFALPLIYAAAGMREEALGIAREIEKSTEENSLNIFHLFQIYRALGDTLKMQSYSPYVKAELEEYAIRNNHGNLYKSKLYAILGDENMVLDILEQGYQNRDGWVKGIKNVPSEWYTYTFSPPLTGITDNPRYQALVKKIFNE